MSGKPLVVACLRHTDHRPGVDPVAGRVTRDPRTAGPSASEWAALELALRVADVWGGRVLAVCVGPPDADRTLREAAAVGAQVLRVQLGGDQPHPGGDHRDPLDPLEVYLDDLAADGRAVASAIAAAVRTVGDPDLVVCGDRSVDRGVGAVPAFLAAEFGAAQALGLVRLDLPSPAVSSPASPDLRGERRLDRGRRELLRIPRPAVVSVEAAGVRLRRASLRAALRAAQVEVPVHAEVAAVPTLHRGSARAYRPRTHVVAPPAGSPRERLLALTGALVERTPPTVARPRSAAEAADALLAYLARAGALPPGAGAPAPAGPGAPAAGPGAPAAGPGATAPAGPGAPAAGPGAPAAGAGGPRAGAPRAGAGG